MAEKQESVKKGYKFYPLNALYLVSFKKPMHGLATNYSLELSWSQNIFLVFHHDKHKCGPVLQECKPPPYVEIKSDFYLGRTTPLTNKRCSASSL
ncbi:hypothetical protein AVEN_26247-1 [Araneus ventricosus]|uniref:Uncharacterized protein n=1 Tax=Araneus ventricosus TaxID=182803 RepID=A0A4Y2AMS7_ARAVE|nr:hypothetical protein AVEN_26247-1 [Araneus ventricosus]